MANPIISGLNNFFSGLRGNTATSGDKGAPAAVGNTSDSTIAAAEAETTKQTTQTQTPSNRNSPTTKRREESEAAKALTEEIAKQETNSSSSPSSSSPTTNWRNSAAGNAISLGTATDAQKVEALEQGASAQNVGFTNVDAIPEGKYINEAGKLDDVSNLLKDATVEKTITAADGSQTVENVRFSTLTEEEKTRYDTDAYSDEVSRQNIESLTPSKLEQQLNQLEIVSTADLDPRVAYQIELSKNLTPTPGLRERADEYERTVIDNAVTTAGDLLIGNTVSFLETQFTNPDKTLNFDDAIWEQLDKWNEYDGSGDYRAQRAIGAAIDVGSLFIGGGIGGAAVKGGTIALSKLGTTAAGNAVVRVVTSPIVNPKVLDTAADALAKIKIPISETAVNTGKTVIRATTTPSAATANILTVAYGADVVNRASEASPTVEGRVAAGLAIAAKELLLGGVGAREGYKVAANIEGYLETRGLKHIPESEISVSGIPLGYTSKETLPKAFKENTLIPAPYVEYDTFLGAVPPGLIQYPKAAKLNPPTSDFIEAWHGTPYGEKFGEKFVVGPSTSEYNGLYVAPVWEKYFSKDIEVPKMSLFVSKLGTETTNQPAAINLRLPGVKTINWQQLANEAGEPLDRVLSSTRLNERLANKFLETKAEKGYAYLPLTKDEYEGVIPVGSEFTQLPTRYYTRGAGNRRIPIKEYEFSGIGKPAAEDIDIPDINAPRKRSGSSYRQPNREPLPVFATIPRGSSYRPKSSRQYSSPKISSVNVPSVKVSQPNTRQYTVPSHPPSTINTPESYRPAGSSSVKVSVPKISSATYNPPRRPAALILDVKKKDTDLKKELKPFTAARTGRIDHLSIVDPAEMLGIGSLTDRNRPDRIMRKQELYFVDGKLTQKKPRGRVRK